MPLSKEKDRERKRLARLAQTDEANFAEREKDKVRKSLSRELESPKVARKRREESLQRTKDRFKKETEEQTQKRRDESLRRTKARHEAETKEQTQKRRNESLIRTRTVRQYETTEQSNKRKAKNVQNMTIKRQCSTTLETAAAKFKESLKDFPCYTCAVCHRLMFKSSVMTFDSTSYTQLNKEDAEIILSPQNLYTLDNISWICVTCDRCLKRGQMPAQAHVNNLQLTSVPKELQDLRPLEKHLISRRIAFHKMVALPKGGQKAIHGPAVNVPTRVDTVCNVLPRLPEDADILPMKLKRKLEYRGHYMYEYIRPSKVIAALQWLKDNNPLYADVEIDENWEDAWQNHDAELWEAITMQPELQQSHGTGMDNVDSKPTESIRLDAPPKPPPRKKRQAPSPPSSGSSCQDISSIAPPLRPHRKKKAPEPPSQTPSNSESRSVSMASQETLSVPPHDTHYKKKLPEPPTSVPSDTASVSHHKNLQSLQDDTLIPQRPARRSSKTHQAPSMTNVATRHGYSVINVPSDGSCFFHAVSKTLSTAGLQQISAGQIRSNLVEYFEAAGENLYSPFVINPSAVPQPDLNDVGAAQEVDMLIATIPDPMERLHQDWLRYIDRLQSGEWADHVTIQGTTDMFNIEIHILCDRGNWTKVTPKSGPVHEHITLGLIGQKHYVGLKLTNENQEDPPVSREEEEDDIAFQISTEQRGLPLESAVLVDTAQEAENIISVAPGENMTPMRFLDDPHFEALANPDKYPYGLNSYTASRKKNITVRKYFNQRLLHADGRFAEDVPYLLAAQYVTEAKQVQDEASIALRQMAGATVGGRKMQARDLKDVSNLRALVRKDVAVKFMKNIRGSPAYWKIVLHDCVAQVRQLGEPTWFLTLSAAETHWPEPIQAIGRQYGYKFTEDEVAHMPWEEKASWIRKNPITTARVFQARVNAFFRDFLCGAANPLGKVTEYFMRIEFQQRGSPHVHCMLWIEDAPKLDTNTDDEVIAFIDKYQTCQSTELSTKYQRHRHSATCRRSGGCRFHYPRPMTDHTLIARPPEDPDTYDREKQRNVMKRVSDVLEEKESLMDLTVNEVLQEAEVTSQEYYEAITTSVSGTHIVQKRNPTETWINNYSENVLPVWMANMDIQYIVDPYSCIMYITSYMMKSERAMGDLLKKVAKESEEEEIRQQLNKVKSTFLNHRQVSAQECAYRLLSLPLVKSTRRSVFVNTNPKERRIMMTKPKSAIDTMDDEDEDLFYKSMVDKYMARPLELENMSYADFCAKYTSDSRDEPTADHEQNLTEEASTHSRLPRIKLQDGIGNMRRRRHDAILRFYQPNKDTEAMYRNKIMLFTAWRNENALKCDFETYADMYFHCETKIKENESKYTHNQEQIEQAVQLLEEQGPPQNAWDLLGRGNDDDAGGMAVIEQDTGPTTEDNIDVSNRNDRRNQDESQTPEFSARYVAEANRALLSPDDYLNAMRSLNTQQRELIMFHRKWCKETILACKNGTKQPTYNIFLSGAGGVGKSHVIKLIRHETARLLRLTGDYDPDDVIVMVTAFTGVAAFNVDGMTLHSAFLLPTGRKGDYLSLTSEKMNTIRSRMGKVRLLIVDEISMVGADLFYTVHRRLQDIMGTSPETRFGDISILCVGDLYQLQPVGQGHVFQLPKDKYAQLAGSLWKESFMLHELTMSMRQRGDPEFGKLLNRVRTASCTQSDLQILQSRVVNEEDIPENTTRVYRTNKEVDCYNSSQLTKQCMKERLVTLQAHDYTKDKVGNLEKCSAPPKASDTGGLREVIEVCKGARVMLTNNVDVSDGLVNGAVGTVHGFIADDNQKIKFLMIKFDDEKVGLQRKSESLHQHEYPQCIAISHAEVSFPIARGRRHVMMTRKQFPITLCWASTVHKVQGKTLSRIVVGMDNGSRWSAGQAYVAFSRVTTLSGLYLLGFDSKVIKVNPAVEKEMDRLANTRVSGVDKPLPLSRNSLKIVLLNVRSFKLHAKDLQMDPYAQAHVYCLTETHLHPTQKVDNSEVPFRASHVVRKDRHERGAKGGVAVLCRPMLQAVEIQTADLEACGVEITTGNRTLRVITLYRKPTSNVTNFLLSLEYCIETLDMTIDTCICGDFNIDLTREPDHKIIKMMHSHGLRQLVVQPTTDYGSLLDHVYTNVRDISIYVRDCYFSDHDYVMMNIPY